MSGSSVCPAARRVRPPRCAAPWRWEAAREYANGALWVLPSLAALLALVVGFTMSQVRVSPGHAAGSDRLPGHGRRRPHPADHGHQHRGHRDRPGPRPDGGRAAAVVDPVLARGCCATSSATGAPRSCSASSSPPSSTARPACSPSACPRGADRGVPAAGHQWVYPAAVRQPGHGGLLRRPPGPLDPDRRHQPARGEQHPPGHRPPGQPAPTRPSPRAPDWAVPLLARQSGYLQTVHPELLLPLATRAGVTICLRARVGQHVIEAPCWPGCGRPRPTTRRPMPNGSTPRSTPTSGSGSSAPSSRTCAFGIRQQIDIACKALSAAINDPYTAVQALDHLTVVCCDIAVRPLGAPRCSAVRAGGAG